MFLRKVGSSDSRFKTMTFHEGMNILLADKTENSTIGDSRNGAGKTSFVRILRYLLGGNLHDSLKSKELQNSSFWAEIMLDGKRPGFVKRPLKPRTKVFINDEQISIEEWKAEVGGLFDLSELFDRPTSSQLVGQLIREHFDDPIKTHNIESSWESGLRIGYFLGFSPEILAESGKITALEKNRKALSKAISDGALGAMTLNESELRARLTQKRSQRSRLESNLSEFRVDDEYVEHQSEANRISQTIREINDESLALEERKRDLKLAMLEENIIDANRTRKQLEGMYAELGVVLPGAVMRRFDEVIDFHMSVTRNRRIFLQTELNSIEEKIAKLRSERAALDERRSSIMSLLNESMARETFRSIERELAELYSSIADLERKLELVQSVSDAGLQLRSMMTKAEASVRAEVAERESVLKEAIDQFQLLGSEIYGDRRDVLLLIEVTNKGVLKVLPKIDGDASAGILGVKIFLLDIVCLVMAIKANRAPRILVHDSLLFDSMDDRQVASCLNIGARMADKYGFQYIVTLNSDRLAAAEAEGFERRDYVIEPVLTDADASGGLFGFRFK